MILKKIVLIFLTVFLTFGYVGVSAEKCEGPDCIGSKEFEIKVGNITPTGTDNLSSQGSAEKVIEFTLGKIIEKLVIAFGVLSVLVMTIGAGFMIIYHGQDELLTRGKSIFSYGLISLIVALSAGFLVNFVSYLLYGS